MTGSTGLGKRRWLLVGVALVVAGALLLVGSVVYRDSLVVVDEDITIYPGGWTLGYYSLDAGDYTVWVEDRYPEIDDSSYFIVFATASGTTERPEGPGGSTTRRIDWVECEQVGTFNGLDEDDWTFHLSNNMYPETDVDVRVFITKEDEPGPAITWSGGVVCLSLGLIALGVVWWTRSHRVEPVE